LLQRLNSGALEPKTIFQVFARADLEFETKNFKIGDVQCPAIHCQFHVSFALFDPLSAQLCKKNCFYFVVKMSTVSKKRQPFTEFEKNLLINLVQKYKSIIKSKQNNPSTISAKQDKWVEIENEFNSEPNVEKRDSKKLKKAWENMKMNCKRDVRA